MVTLKTVKTKKNWVIEIEKQDDNTYFIMARKSSTNSGEELTAQEIIDDIQ